MKNYTEDYTKGYVEPPCSQNVLREADITHIIIRHMQSMSAVGIPMQQTTITYTCPLCSSEHTNVIL